MDCIYENGQSRIDEINSSTVCREGGDGIINFERIKVQVATLTESSLFTFVAVCILV